MHGKEAASQRKILDCQLTTNNSSSSYTIHKKRIFSYDKRVFKKKQGEITLNATFLTSICNNRNIIQLGLVYQRKPGLHQIRAIKVLRKLFYATTLFSIRCLDILYHIALGSTITVLQVHRELLHALDLLLDKKKCMKDDTIKTFSVIFNKLFCFRDVGISYIK